VIKSKLGNKHKNIQKLYKKGMRLVDIAKKYNVTPEAIGRIIKTTIGLRPLTTKNWLPEYSKIQKLYKNGKTLSEIAIIYNTSYFTIRRILKSTIGIKPADRINWIPEYKKIQKLYKQGMSAPAIAKLYHANSGTIAGILKKTIGLRPDLRKDWVSEKDNIIQLYQDGKSLLDIAKSYGRTKSSINAIKKVIINNNLKVRSHRESFDLVIKQKKYRSNKHPCWIKDRTKLSSYTRNLCVWNRRKYGSWGYFSFLFKKKHNFTCALTRFHAKYSRELETHHIIPVNVNPELCFKESNLICIKKEIHRLFHKLYGVKCTKKGWNNFVNNKEYL
jgi:5-methylcytosine-specific restriction endonuclease McrA/predicted DNA-binding protein YlxM (UPF0122 family)